MTQTITSYELGFPIGRNNATFWDKRTEVPSLSQDKGSSAKSCHGTKQAGAACQNPGQDTKRDSHYFSVKIRDRTWYGTGQSLFAKYAN